jgi:glutathione S-transferase
MSLTILGGNVSPFVRKVRVFCAEKGIAYDLQPVNPFSPPPGFRDISPLGRIPVLRDGDKHLPDSSVICAYLERKHPKPALVPSDLDDYARTLWLEEYVDGGLIPKAGPNVFFPLVLKPLFTGQPVDETEPLRFAAEELPPYFEYLEKEIGDREFFVGDRLTLADITVATPFVNLRHAGVAPERKRFPKLRAFIDRMHGRPSFKACIEEESPVFGKRADRIRD